jgi:hypothetical protein
MSPYRTLGETLTCLFLDDEEVIYCEPQHILSGDISIYVDSVFILLVVFTCIMR